MLTVNCVSQQHLAVPLSTIDMILEPLDDETLEANPWSLQDFTEWWLTAFSAFLPPES